MKKISLFVVLLSLVLAVSCGDDKKKKRDNVAYYDMTQNPFIVPTSSVINGLYNPQTYALEVGGQVYQLNQIYGLQQGGQQAQPLPGQMIMPGQMPGQMSYPTQQLGQQFLYSAHQQILQSQGRIPPAVQDGNGVRFNVRVTLFIGRYPQMPNPIPVLTAPVVAF